MKIIVNTITDYYKSIPPDREKKLKSIQKLIKQAFPDVKSSMKYNMPTFERVGKWIALGNQKNYYSVYTCMYPHIDSYVRKHPKTKHGKGCLNFSDKDEIDLTELKKVIVHTLI